MVGGVDSLPASKGGLDTTAEISTLELAAPVGRFGSGSGTESGQSDPREGWHNPVPGTSSAGTHL